MPRWIVLALLAMGCGHAAQPIASKPAPPRVVIPPAPPPVPLPLDRDFPRLVERILGMYGGLADALIGTCSEITPRLDALAEQFADVVNANHKVVLDGHTAELRAALAHQNSQLAALGRRIVTSPAITSCAGDAAFTAALDKVVGGDRAAGGSP